jgi:hypothetical protein
MLFTMVELINLLSYIRERKLLYFLLHQMRSHAMLATQSNLFVPSTVDAPFHALLCRQVLFLLDDITTPLPHAITNPLQEFKDVFPIEIPPDCHL